VGDVNEHEQHHEDADQRATNPGNPSNITNDVGVFFFGAGREEAAFAVPGSPSTHGLRSPALCCPDATDLRRAFLREELRLQLRSPSFLCLRQ
jgi:hypothetical protein